MRAVLRRAVFQVTAAAGASVLAAGMTVAGAGPAAATPAVLYAAPTATGAGDCSDAADACTLSTALAQVTAGETIELVTPGGTAHYVGNWSVGTAGTSAGAPVTIEAAPVLDGNDGSATGCSTPSAPCDGPVLTVPGGEFVALSGLTIADGDNTSTFVGGGLDNAGTVTITGSTFSGNIGGDYGGAIDSGDGFGPLGGTGSVTVTASTFTGNSAFSGAAINSGANQGGGVGDGDRLHLLRQHCHR